MVVLTQNSDTRAGRGDRLKGRLAAAWRSAVRTAGAAVRPPAPSWEGSTSVRPAERAEALEHALDDCAARWGADHPRTIAARNNLASKYSVIGRRGAAIAQFEQALEDAVRVLGEEHPQTEVVRENLAHCYEDSARFDEAAQHWERLVHQRTERLGPHAADTLISHAHLALAYRRTNRLDAAITHYGRALDTPPDIPAAETESWRIGLALALKATGHPEEAGQQFQIVLEQRRRRLGPRHHQTLTVHYQLGRAHALAEREAEAVRVLQAAYRDCLAAAGDPEVRLLALKVRRDLAAAYRAVGRAREAAALY